MLENLNLSWCDQITRDGIEALSRGCNTLKALFLRGCTQVLYYYEILSRLIGTLPFFPSYIYHNNKEILVKNPCNIDVGDLKTCLKSDCVVLSAKGSMR